MLVTLKYIYCYVELDVTVLNFEFYEDGEILVQMNSYQVLKEDPVLWVNSLHNNSLLIASFCY